MVSAHWKLKGLYEHATLSLIILPSFPQYLRPCLCLPSQYLS
jgi:hypothetical protein